MDRLDLTSAPLLARDADIIILGDFNFGRDVRVVVIDTDRYERSVGWVQVGATDVNAELVGQGVAWIYRQSVQDLALFALEDEARVAKRGLWALRRLRTAHQQLLRPLTRTARPAPVR